jgi:hypothetical protein
VSAGGADADDEAGVVVLRTRAADRGGRMEDLERGPAERRRGTARDALDLGPARGQRRDEGIDGGGARARWEPQVADRDALREDVGGADVIEVGVREDEEVDRAEARSTSVAMSKDETALEKLNNT